MARCRFVTPDSVRLSLSDGDWIEVKAELNAGEQRHLFAGLVKSMKPGVATELDPEQVGKTKLLSYIVDWSLRDANGAKVPVTSASLDALEVDTYQELNTVIDAHEEAIEKARAERKNSQAGARPSSATSLSAVS